MPTTNPKPAGLGGLVVVSTQTPFLSIKPAALGGLVTAQLPFLGTQTPRPAALGGLVVASGTTLPTAPGKPYALSGELVASISVGFHSPLPAALGGLIVVGSPIPTLSPLPAALSGVVVASLQSYEAAPLPGALSGLVVISDTLSFTTPVPAALSGLLTISGDVPFLSPLPAALGGLVVISSDVPFVSPLPAPQGAMVVVSGTVPFLSPLPAALSGELITSFPLGGISSKPSALGGLISIEIDPGGSALPFVPAYPKALGGLVTASFPDLIQVDFTNRMISEVWRNNDYTRFIDLVQLTHTQHAVANWLAMDHSMVTGGHSVTLTSLGTTVKSNVNIFQGGNPVGTVILANTAAVGSMNDGTILKTYILNITPLSPTSSVIEPIIGYENGNAYQYAISVTGGAVHTFIETREFVAPTEVAVAPATGVSTINVVLPDTYDASQIRLGFTKNHYTQILSGSEMMYNAWLQQHSLQLGQSKIDLEHSTIHTRYNKSAGTAVATEAGSTKVTVLMGAIPSSPCFTLFGVGGLPGSDGVGLIRLAVDDTNIYAYIESLGSFSATTLSALIIQAEHLVDDTTYAAMDHTIGTTRGKNIRSAEYQRLRANLIKQIALFSRDHNPYTGEHQFPFERTAGFSEAYSGTVTAPSAVNNKTTIAVCPRVDGKTYFVYAKGAAAGCGIVSVTLGYDTTSVYVILERLTAGTSHSFTAKVWSVTNS